MAIEALYPADNLMVSDELFTKRFRLFRGVAEMP